MAVELARRLREGTADVHRAAERMTLVQALLRGLTSRSTYAALVAAYLDVYTSLEAALRQHAEHPVVQHLIFPELWRCQALRADLAVLAPDRRPPPSRAAKAYCRRIEVLAADDPTGLVAHAYTRYLGDLSGGQVLGRIIGRALGLHEGAGIDFYAFPQISDVQDFKHMYRDRLNRLPIDEETAAAVIIEARRAFAYNMELFAELEGSALKGLLHLVRGRRARQAKPMNPG